MPSAAAKLEKQASTEAVDPIKQAIIVIEHKIRNLEKRKRKIEIYREEQKNGKELNSDQLNAVEKYDEVQQTLEFARELCKQFNGIAVDAAKQHKKQARKDAQEKALQEMAKVKEILLVQDVLQNMGQDNVREDFLAGRNGAAQLTEEDLKYLDDLYVEVSPKHGSEEGLPAFQVQVQQSAEHLLAIVDAKPKEIVGTTYAKLKELVATIHACGYFEQTSEDTVEETVEELVVAEPEGQPEEEEEVAEEEEVETAAFTAVTAASQPVPAVVPTPVAAVESSFFSTAAATFVPNQVPLPVRPLNEVIGSVSGSFNFLQDSELDSPDLSVMLTGATGQQGQPTPPPGPVAVAPIPTQTFTNQNFAAVSTAPVQQQVVYQPPSEMSQAHIPGFVTTTPNPPPPIPMPPSHQQQPAPALSPVTTYAAQAQQQFAGQTQDTPDTADHQQVPEQPAPVPQDDGGDDWGQSDLSAPADWSQQIETNTSDWSQQPDEWNSVSASQSDAYITQGSNRNYGGRGRGGRGGGRGGAPNGYSGGRGRGNFQNGRGSSGGGYGYRNNEGSNTNYYQNGYQQRDNFSGGNNNYGGGYKRGARGGGAPRGGMERGGSRGGSGGRGGGGSGNRGNRGGNFVRGGGNKQ